MRYLFLALAAALVLEGCGGGDDDETTVFDYAGHWQGPWTDGSGTATMTLAPVGDHLEGHFASNAACTGGWDVFGLVVGGNLELGFPAISAVVYFTQLGSDQISTTGPVMIPPCGLPGQLMMTRTVPVTAEPPADSVVHFLFDERGNLIGEGRRRSR
jgi:hypothetical protein